VGITIELAGRAALAADRAYVRVHPRRAHQVSTHCYWLLLISTHRHYSQAYLALHFHQSTFAQENK
jgi:hypothetical protein